MANTVWKGQLTFGLVSFPVRLMRAARKDRLPLRYVREVKSSEAEDGHIADDGGRAPATFPVQPDEDDEFVESPSVTAVSPVRQAYVADDDDRSSSISSRELQRGYEVQPGQFAVVRTEELRRLRQPTSSSMEIVRSVQMNEIDPVFLETSYYVLPGNGGEHSYGLFYRALKESGYAALAEVAMHGRQHVVVIRPGSKGLIAHTMYYANEVRSTEEYAAEAASIPTKEVDLAKRFVEAIGAPFQPEEFTDRYREQLAALIESKETIPTTRADDRTSPPSRKVIDIMDALRESLNKANAAKAARKPATSTGAPAKVRKRRA